ncbi:MAG: SIMPL domain-containing protein [Cyanobacteria bacterium J06573_2]
MLAENDSLLGLDDSAVENRDPLTGGISLTNVENAKNILQVTSKGEVTVPTSITTVNLGIQVQAPTAAEVQQQVAEQTTNVIDVLENLEVQELQTTSVRLFPTYSFENDTRILTGFEGRNT